VLAIEGGPITENAGVAWFNHHRLLEPIGCIPLAEAEANYYRQRTNPNICVKGFGADLSTAEGVACDERPTRWASRVHVTPGR
jgi:hypothetical protein